jgi:hypothetical protein
MFDSDTDARWARFRIGVGATIEFDRLLRGIREVQGILNSQTNILLDTA